MLNNSEARKRYNEYKELFNKAVSAGFKPEHHPELAAAINIGEKTSYMKNWLHLATLDNPEEVYESNRCNSTNREFQCILDKHVTGDHTAYDMFNLKVTWSQPVIAYTTPRRLAEVPF